MLVPLVNRLSGTLTPTHTDRDGTDATALEQLLAAAVAIAGAHTL